MGNRRSTFLHFSKIVRWRLTKVESAMDTNGGWASCRLDSIVSFVSWLVLSVAADILTTEVTGDGAV